MSVGNDRNLLFGIVALQLDLISRDQLIAGMSAWTFDKEKPLADFLVAQGVLTADDRAMLDPLVDRHVQQHGSPQESIAALSSVESVHDALGQIPAPDVHATLAHIKPRDDAPRVSQIDDYATVAGSATDSASRFKILRPHAKGGLGIVFVAHDQEINRQVALKEIQLHRANDPDSRARFILEAEITGSLEHPGIVPVYGLGHYADGRPYYAMRFIKGDSLKEAVDAFHKADLTAPDRPRRDPVERSVALRQLLRRFIDVCNAIEYAHSKGVLHRDLKPGNIMLGKFGETLVVDWGLAKTQRTTDLSSSSHTLDEVPLQPSSASGSAQTQMGSAIGTPAFMSPEQAAGRHDLLGPASDVYCLGSTLYYVLTSKTPFSDGDLFTTLLRVQMGDFARPRDVKPSIDPPLEAICLKAMSLASADRYVSADALRKDLENWIADAPVSAWPDPFSVRAGRWLRSHRVTVAVAIATLLGTIVFLVILNAVTTRARDQLSLLAGAEKSAKLQAERERHEADLARSIANARANDLQAALVRVRAAEKEAVSETKRLSVRTGFAADGAWESGKSAAAIAFLDDIPQSLRGWEWRYRQRRFRGGYATLTGHQGVVNAVAFDSNGHRLVSGSGDKTLKVWDARTGIELLNLIGHQEMVTSAAFSPDAAWIVSGSADSTLKIWNSRTGELRHTLNGHEGAVNAVKFSPDGLSVLSAGWDTTLKLWDVESGGLDSHVWGALQRRDLHRLQSRWQTDRQWRR